MVGGSAYVSDPTNGRIREYNLETLTQALDLPVGTVRSRLHRARGRVRAALERADMRAAAVGPCTDDHIDEGKQS